MTKPIALGIAGLLAVIALFVGLDMFGMFYQAETSDMRGRANAESQINGAANRIQSYDTFFALCGGIQAKEAAIDALQLNTDMPKGQISAAISANQVSRSQLITEYNAKTNAVYTTGRFKSSGLPGQIPLDLYTGQNKTACH